MPVGLRIELGCTAEGTLDLALDLLDISVEWDEGRIVETPDFAPCADAEGADAQWQCIEDLVDSANVTAVCYEAGAGEASE